MRAVRHRLRHHEFPQYRDPSVGQARVEACLTRRAVRWRKFGDARSENRRWPDGNRAHNSRAAAIVDVPTLSSRGSECRRAAIPDLSRAIVVMAVMQFQSRDRVPVVILQNATACRTAPFSRACGSCNIEQSICSRKQDTAAVHARSPYGAQSCMRSSDFIVDCECQQAKSAVAERLHGSFIATSVNATCALFCQIMTAAYSRCEACTNRRENFERARNVALQKLILAIWVRRHNVAAIT